LKRNLQVHHQKKIYPLQQQQQNNQYQYKKKIRNNNINKLYR
jgi:hypothetical protein